jgi:hypothetical protein
MNVIAATLLLDVRGGMREVRKELSRSMRKEIQQAGELGVKIREGTELDVAQFFELMASTCSRQKTRPNPPDVQAMTALWQAFIPDRSIRLTFAEASGQRIAGLCCIPFGKRVTLWKKGWNASHPELHANSMLAYDAFQWAMQQGYEECDFVAVKPDIARAVLNQVPLSESQRKTRDLFNLRLGGKPKLLPDAWIYIPNPALRLLYKQGSRFRFFWKMK